MSIGADAGTPESEGLQFDRAEFEQPAPAAVSCTACKRPIEDSYHEINGAVVCGPCLGLISEHLRGGSGFVRFLRALAFGTGAAVVGTAGYAAFIKATHIDFGLVSILVGYLIGRAVRAGSRNRGGLLYQVVAVLLTYLAIGVTYTTVFVMLDPNLNMPNGPSTLAGKAVLYSIVAVALPVLKMKESVITIVIVGFALFQAWKMNVKAKWVVTGPYRVGEAGPDPASEGAPAHA